MKTLSITLFLSLITWLLPESPQPPDTSPPTEMAHAFNTDNSHNSDYYYIVTWSGFYSNFCSCSMNRSLVGWKNNWQNCSYPPSNDCAYFYIGGVAEDDYSYQHVGPGRSDEIFFTAYYSGQKPVGTCATSESCSTLVNSNESRTGVTTAIKAPSGVKATDDEFLDKIIITWTSETDIPSDQHSFVIYRDGITISAVIGSELTYTDNAVSQGESYSYAVTTYANTPAWGIHESSQSAPGAYDTGSTLGIDLDATDGAYANRTKLSWNNISASCDEIRIERSIHGSGGNEELAILSANATAYSDQNGIPGYDYTYTLSPITEEGTILPDTDNGFSKPNGKISGHVKSQLGAGVIGVEVNVTISPLSDIPTGGQPLPDCTETYCAITNAEGYYEIKDIYYFDGAEFIVVPFKMGSEPHEFTPDTITRSLDENSNNVTGIDFTDLTVFTVGGRITYPESSNGASCGIKDVKILLDGSDFGIKSDANGDWSFAIQDEGTYSFEPVFLHHHFENATGDAVSTFLIAADKTDINFEDIETDFLNIIVQGGCAAPLGGQVEVLVTSPGNCFEETHLTDANGLLTLYNLPATKYTVMVTNILPETNPNYSTIADQIFNIGVDIDLTVRDTAETIITTDTDSIIAEYIETLPNGEIITHPEEIVIVTTYDTSYNDVVPTVKFIYRSPLSITANFEDGGAEVTSCTNSEGEAIILMEQGSSYIVQFEVKELLGTDCYIDTGFLKIYDYISDREGTAIEVPIIGGYATYVIDAGNPITASNPLFHDHEKLLYVIPEVDLVESAPLEYWIFVTGTKSNTPTFFTRTPEIPSLILHDPPGDGSYSFIEKGSSFTSFSTSEVLVGGEGGVYLDLYVGAKVLTAFSDVGAAANIKFEASAGRDNFDREGLFHTMTFNERFSTSDLENLTGNDGDVYIGAAYNQEFSLSELLTFDPATCTSNVDIVPSLSGMNFATTFVYTEKHIKATLLPTISFLKESILDDQPFENLSAEDQAQVNNLIADSLSWSNVLKKNEWNRDSLAEFKENISFSAGAPISKELSSENVSMISYEYNTFFNTEFALGAKITAEGGAWTDTEFGIMGKVRWSESVNEGTEDTQTRTVGYVLDDNDLGDFLSVDILKDTAYNVPAFKLKLGTTSCPQEPGTQARDRATILIFPPEQTNIPRGEPANFICQITNISESFETREYAVRVIGTSNPDGLIVTLAGQWIGSGDGTFFLEHNQTANLVLSFDQGPLASVYENVAVMIYPPCEYELWQDNGNLVNADTAYISRIEWQTICTDVALSLPDDGWLVNQQSNDTIHAAFAGYDTNNELFESLTIQIKKEGEGYVNQFTVDKEDLTGPFYDVFLDVSNFPDGKYRLRAKAFCGGGGGITYSSEKTGTIDRTSIAPFGIPTPSDGFLREGQEVSVRFDKLINCDIDNYPNDITLVREDTGEPIPFTTSCFENKIIINTSPPLLDQLDLEGVLVTARVAELQDGSGNVQKYATEWSFLVNVSPVFWDPGDLYMSGYQGEQHTMSAMLKNTSLLSKAFSLEIADDPSIIEYPAWLTPLKKRGSILSENESTIEFAVDTNLLPGIYTGVVAAMVDGLPVSMNVTFELLAKPVNWPFNSDAYQYSMTVVAQFSLDDTDTNLSTDSRDLVGAFVGGQIRGVSNIEYIPSLDVYRAFLTVYSNVLGGGGAETVNFRFWRALSGVEYSAVEDVTFTLDKTTGTVESPFILHPIGFHQVIPLNKGWNWISLNLEADDMSKEQIFLNLLDAPSGNAITIKSKAQTTTYSPSSNWSGSLSNLQLGPGYLVHLSNAPDTLRVAGLPSPSTIVLDVSGNWSWIGFPRLNPEPVGIVLTGLSAAETGDILKSQTQFSAFQESTSSWLGNLKFFNPGKGYKLNLQNAGTIIFDASRGDGFETDPYKYEYNMNINGAANLSLIGEEEEEDLIVGAFIEDECRGVGYLEFNDKLQVWRVVMLVNGNVADIDKEIEFRFKNDASGSLYVTNGEQLGFAPDAIEGTIEIPYQFFQGTTAVKEAGEWAYGLEQSRPNPTSGHVEIGFQVPVKGKVQMILFDMNGNEVLTAVDNIMSPGRHVAELDLTNLPVGLYYYELRTNEFSGVKKLVKQ